MNTTQPIPNNALADTDDGAVLVTNNAGTDVVVISGHNNDDDSTGVVYEQDQLTLMNTTDGKTIISQGSTASIALSDPLYNFIVADSDHLYPLKVVGEMIDLDTLKYPPIVVTDADKQKMQLAEQFNQKIAAYPSSNMAKEYQAIMTQTNKDATSVGDIDDAIKKFFAKYKDYKTLDLASVTALSTYYKRCVFPWTEYSNDYSYYLYSVNGTKLELQGELVFKSDKTIPPDITQPNTGCKVTFKISGKDPIDIIYDQGQFVSSVSMPDICLQGVYVLKSTLTKKADDNYFIPVLSGTVYGLQVMGTKNKKSSDGKSDPFAWIHSSYFAALMALMGLVFAIDFMSGGAISEKLKALRERLTKKKADNKGKDPSKEEADKIKSQLEELNKKMESVQNDLRERLKQPGEAPKDFDAAVGQVQEAQNKEAFEAKKGVNEDKIENQRESIEKVAEFKVDPQVEELAKEVIKNKTALEDASPSNIDNISKDIDTVNPKISAEVQKAEVQLSEQAKETIRENEIEMNEIQEKERELREQEQLNEEGELPEVEPDPIEK